MIPVLISSKETRHIINFCDNEKHQQPEAESSRDKNWDKGVYGYLFDNQREYLTITCSWAGNLDFFNMQSHVSIPYTQNVGLAYR